MNIVFDKEYLSDLYFNGKTNDKKHRFQPEVVRSYQKAVVILANAERIEDLYVFKSLNYEVLVGDKKRHFFCKMRTTIPIGIYSKRQLRGHNYKSMSSVRH